MNVRFVGILGHAQSSIAADCGALVCGRGHARDVGEGVTDLKFGQFPTFSCYQTIGHLVAIVPSIIDVRRLHILLSSERRKRLN